MDRWGYCLRGVKEYLATERQTWGKKTSTISPSPPQKGGHLDNAIYVRPGHVRCTKTVSAAYQFRCHYKQLRDLEFSTSQSIRVFRIFRCKKTLVKNVFDER